MADAELDVMLEPANDLEDEIDSPEVDADVQGGRFAAGRRGGGVGRAGGLAALGSLVNPITAILAILTAILSQLRSVQQFTGGIFRTVQRKLAPLIAGFIQAFRPAFTRVADFLANFDIRNALSNGFQNMVRSIQKLGEKILSAVGIDATLTPQGPGRTPSQQELRESSGIPTGQAQPTQGTNASRPNGVSPFFADALDSLNPKTADRQDEEKKEIIANSFTQKGTEKTGGNTVG